MIARLRDSARETIARSFMQVNASLLAVLAAQYEVSQCSRRATTWSRSVKGHAVETALEATSRLAPLVGAASFRRSSRLAKSQRDLNGFLYADGIHDSLFQAVGRSLVNEEGTAPAEPSTSDPDLGARVATRGRGYPLIASGP
jgi:alkylation response protein AidB-like acyl-CoA dehydrogenase